VRLVRFWERDDIITFGLVNRVLQLLSSNHNDLIVLVKAEGVDNSITIEIHIAREQWVRRTFRTVLEENLLDRFDICTSQRDICHSSNLLSRATLVTE